MMKQYKVTPTTRFKKSLKGLMKQNRLNIEELGKVITLLSNNQLLPPKYENHPLNPKKKRYMGMPCTTRCFT